MVINFRKAIEFLFKSFDISWDTKSLEKLEKEWHRFLMVIKRHWIYWIMHSWRVFFVMIIAIINSYLLLFSWSWYSTLWIVISAFLTLNVFYWIWIIIIYLVRYYHINWSESYVEDIYSSIKKNKASDEAFSKFFNQTIFLLIVLFWVAIFSSITAFTWMIWNSKWFGSWAINVVLIFFQIWLFYSYLKNMINLEMDFKIVIPGQILFFNQNWILGWNTQNMNSDKIKTMNTKYSWILWSFFNYWNIVVLTEWDQWWNWEMVMDYTWNPTKTVKEIQKVLNNDLELIEKEVNVFLKKVENEIWICDVSCKENVDKLKKFVNEKEEIIKKIYEEWDEETKREVKELYVILTK